MPQIAKDFVLIEEDQKSLIERQKLNYSLPLHHIQFNFNIQYVTKSFSEISKLI